MSNRMSVLSRRLERLAAGFSVVIFACFLVGLYAAANNLSRVVYLSAGLGSVCLFAAFFLWVAHGFAWAMIPEAPVVAKRPAEAMKAAEEKKAEEEKKAAEEKVIAPEEDPPDAKYTITGRRVY